MSEQTSSSHNDQLANEAIKRILLDMVVRGHGDRLIGRWSRQPELQKFLEQVPYLLDRINQLHLVCARRSSEGHDEKGQPTANSDDEWELSQADVRRGHSHHFRHHTGDDNRSALRDFIGLIGREHHWLVRTRDALGLTPLHKAILHGNRPIAEYIIDRYADEMAATSWRPLKQSAPPAASKCPARLLDAQDRYGRTALHYAAGHLAEARRAHLGAGGSRGARERRLTAAAHLYQLLVARGAFQGVLDFRGKKAAEYARQPGQLRARSILHLANKLNASYQANVLTKTLRVGSSGCSYATADTGAPEPNRASMSVSCADLSVSSQTTDEQPDCQTSKRKRSRSSLTDLDQVGLASEIGIQTSSPRVEQPAADGALELSNLSDEPTTNKEQESPTEAVKRLKAERSLRVPVDERTRRLVRRALADANLSRLSELLVSGLGEVILAEMPTSCWNILCRRYVSQIVPLALRQVDELHERIAANEPMEVQQLLAADPILARLLRPYKRASMNALHVAVHFDRRTLVSELIRAFPELVNARDSLGCTCLHWAARSLRQERLYRWLLDHFGAQLEQVRDLRGKLAADYRQQAIRLATFGQRPVGRRRASDARELLERSQIRSDYLSVGGVSSSIENRRLRAGKRGTNAGRRSSGESLVARAAPALDTPTPLRPTSLDEPEEAEQSDESRANSADGPLDHFGVIPCTSDSSSMDASALGGEREVDGVERAGAELASGRVEAERRTLSAREAQRRPANGQQSALLAASARRHSDCVQAVGVPGLPEQSDEQDGPLGELARLDSGELERSQQQDRRAEGARDSPLATTSLPLSRPLSASNKRELDSMVVDAVSSDNFERLERLLLAGCGQRLLRVYGDEFARAPQLVSARMRLYLTKRAPEYLATIERIHSVVHECYALTADALRPPSAAFHRLCSLLVSRRLIMSRDRHGASPLHIALMRADRRLADYLLRRHPGAASAPDYDGRHSLHYAALALSVHQQHGNLHLHQAGPPNSSRPAGFWPLDVAARQLHEDLCAHYADLVAVRDRPGFTCAEYLSRSAARDHVHLESNERLAPTAIARCCPEYASILERYNYLISFHNAAVASANNEQVAQAQTSTKPTAPKVSETSKSVVDEPSAGSSQPKQRRSGSRPRSRSHGRHHHRHRRQHHHHGQHSHRQKHSGGATSTNQHRKHHRHHHKRHSHGRHQHHLGHTNPVLVPPSQVGVVGAPSRGNQSVVGGVIVPTIMHNDKLDEIETYDIIYKQPPTLPVSPVEGTKIASSIISPSSSSSRFSGSQDDSDSITDSNNEHDDKNVTDSDSDADSYSGSRSGSFSDSQSGPESGGDSVGASGRGTDSDESLSDASQSAVGERVGRLTSEFERRVRREKSELRAKVDQIMDEIKLSAKSTKTTKLLGQNAGNESSQVMLSLVEDNRAKVSAAPTSRASVASSSGRSSASNLTSSGVSRTVSSASSNSSASACSSASSTLNGQKQQQQAQNFTETLGRPNDLGTPSIIRTEAPKISQLEQQPQPQQQLSSHQQPLVSKNAYGQTYLHFMASRAQSPSTLYKVLERSSKLVGERDLFYRSARDVAVQFNLTVNVQTLDKFVIDQFIAGNAHLLRHLLHEGYSPLVHVSDADGNDITLILKLLKLAKMLRFLVYMADFQRWRDELHTFIRNGYFAGASKLARKHRELIGARSAHSRTSLHLAVLFGRRELVDELLELSPQCIHLVDNMGRSALHYAYGLPASSGGGGKREGSNEAAGGSSNNNNAATSEITESDTEYIRRKLVASGANADLRDVRMRTPKFYFIFKREIDEIRRMELEFN